MAPTTRQRLRLAAVPVVALAVYMTTILLTLPPTPVFADEGGFSAETLRTFYERLKPSPNEIRYWTEQGRVGLAIILAFVTLAVGLTWVVLAKLDDR